MRVLIGCEQFGTMRRAFRARGHDAWSCDLMPARDNSAFHLPTRRIAPRIVNGRPRWANQTDAGQNRLPPGDDHAMLRAATYPGIASACADQWGSLPVLSMTSAMPFLSRASETRDLLEAANV